MLLKLVPKRSLQPLKLFSVQDVINEQSDFVKTVFKKLDEYNSEYQSLNQKLLDQNEESDQKELIEHRKKIASLGKYVSMHQKYFNNFKQTDENQEILANKDEDAELKEMAREELETLKEALEELNEEVIEAIIPEDETDQRDVTLEVRSAMGGSESSLFSEDLANMYQAYCKRMGWRVTQKDWQVDTQIGAGCKKGVFQIQGEGVYGVLKHESGVHKVQRVPETEKQGRMHSSTCIIVVLPEVPFDFELNMKDVRIDVYRAQGAGGQHVNKTESAVRAHHIPTGIEAQCQDGRSQIDNKRDAIEVLKQRVYQKQAMDHSQKLKANRKAQMGSGGIQDKIRTYNWPNNRITDHRLGESKFGIDNMLSGGQVLEDFIDELIEVEQKEKLEAILSEYK